MARQQVPRSNVACSVNSLFALSCPFRDIETLVLTDPIEFSEDEDLVVFVVVLVVPSVCISIVQRV